MRALDTDGDLVLDSLRDPSRFAGVFDRHADAVFAYLARRVGRSGAEDLLGEVFRIAFERRDAFRADAPSARPWLFGIATNLIHRHRRDELRQIGALARLGGRAGHEPDLATRSAARIDDRRVLDAVVAVLRDLPVGERDALLLYAWEDLSYAEVAIALAVPVGTVRSRIHRARTRIAAALADVTPNPRLEGDADDGD